MTTQTEPVWDRLDAKAEQDEGNYCDLGCEYAEHGKTECSDDEVRDILAAAGKSTDDLRRYVRRLELRREQDNRGKELAANSAGEMEALKAERAQAQQTIDNLRAQYETTAERCAAPRIIQLDSQILSKMHGDNAAILHVQQILRQTAEPGLNPWDWRNARTEEIESPIPGVPMM